MPWTRKYGKLGPEWEDLNSEWVYSLFPKPPGFLPGPGELRCHFCRKWFSVRQSTWCHKCCTQLCLVCAEGVGVGGERHRGAQHLVPLILRGGIIDEVEPGFRGYCTVPLYPGTILYDMVFIHSGKP